MTAKLTSENAVYPIWEKAASVLNKSVSKRAPSGDFYANLRGEGGSNPFGY